MKILSANVLFFVDKDRAIALIRENIIRGMLYLVHSRKIFSAKISRYTVHVQVSSHFCKPEWKKILTCTGCFGFIFTTEYLKKCTFSVSDTYR